MRIPEKNRELFNRDCKNADWAHEITLNFISRFTRTIKLELPSLFLTLLTPNAFIVRLTTPNASPELLCCQTHSEFFPQHDHRFYIQIPGRGPVQQQFALCREALLCHGIIEQEQRRVVGEEPELVCRIVAALYISRIGPGPAEPLTGWSSAPAPSRKMFCDHFLHVSRPCFVLCMGCGNSTERYPFSSRCRRIRHAKVIVDKDRDHGRRLIAGVVN